MKKLLALLAFLIAALALTATAQQLQPSTPEPAPAPAEWRGLIGEYGPDKDPVIILEKDGKLTALFKRTNYEVLCAVISDGDGCAKAESTSVAGNETVPANKVRSPSIFVFAPQGDHAKQAVQFTRDAKGRATQITINGTALPRRNIEPETGNQLHITPVRPVPELMKEALAAKPPVETGDFLPTDLVELTKLDPTIHLEVRYATTNNFLGTKFYSAERAFMQRPAAQAVARANAKLKPLGYGLLIHDAYRPWYVTKVFWDATPADKHIFVADPSKGSRHNRGCAVDLTLYDLKTGKPIEMVSTYDETTDRAYPDYPGGTSLQRWHRQLLRRAMEAEGFTVYEAEWWHFDYRDFQKYRIGNLTFEQIK